MKIPFFRVDAFTDKPFHGNPAAVVILSLPRETQWVQNVAKEMNLSETAFLWPLKEGYSLRWFTPAVEVELCGHASLASAHVLWEARYLKPRTPAHFFTRSGRLTCEYKNTLVTMDFPAEPAEPLPPVAGLLEALGVRAKFTGRNRFDYFVEVDTEEEVRGLQPDFGLLARLVLRGVMVTAASWFRRYDFVSGFFAPAVGVDEDPVTGSAHCALGPYWSQRLGKKRLKGFQVSPRGGLVRVEVRGERVLLGGKAVTVMQGELLA